MARVAVVRDDGGGAGPVVNLVEVEPGANWSPPAGHVTVPAPEPTKFGDAWNGITFVPGPPPTPDTTAPQVLGVQTLVGTLRATVSFQTDEPAACELEYGLTAAYGSTITVPAFATSHAITLIGLAALT